MYLIFRGVFDRVVAFWALIVLSPIILIAVVLVKRDGGPALFYQERLGKNARSFMIIKLRTMVVNADSLLDENGCVTGDRITPIGRVLRKTSIDELTQFINILKGDMGLIGPRPILPRMLPYMTVTEKERFDILPGVTGLSQIKGRNFLKWSRRFKYDIIYARHASLWLDLFIVWKTIITIIRRDNIAPDRNADMVDDITIRPLKTT